VANMTYVFEALTGNTDPDVSVAEDTGARRAKAHVPLSVVMAGYRVGFRFMWEASLAEAKQLADISTDALLEATSQIMIAQDTFTQAMTGAYRQQLTLQVLEQEEQRSALVEAILFGQITDTQNLWEAADILRLPLSGPYVVVAAEVPGIGRSGLPEIANKLDTRDIRSAWRLLPDLQVGIVHLRRPAIENDLVGVLRQVARTHVGVSAPFDDLTDTGAALRLARLAIAGKAPDDQLVRVFDDSPLAFAVSAPEAMQRIGASVLGPLDQLPAEDHATLLTTFEAWLDTGGSTNATAAKIFVHPNTVRLRLHRLEEHTGRSLSRPRDIAELCLAFEIERRLPKPSLKTKSVRTRPPRSGAKPGPIGLAQGSVGTGAS
jgi:sugar diacid utilization regulator